MPDANVPRMARVLRVDRDFHFALRIRAFIHQHASPHARFLHRTLRRSLLKPRSTWNRLEPTLSGHSSDTALHLCSFFARRTSLHSEAGRRVDIYRRICLTRFLCFRRRVRGKHLTGLWWNINRSWMRRFHEPKATWWEKPWGRLAEELWLTGPVQSRRPFFDQPTRRKGYRGLGFPGESGPGLDRALIEQHLSILDDLVDATGVDEVYSIYGDFWNKVFSEFARKANKKYWVKESTGAVVHRGGPHQLDS